MNDGYIHVPASKKRLNGNSCTVRISKEAYEILSDIYDESTLSMTQLASLLIIEASKRVVYDKEI